MAISQPRYSKEEFARRGDAIYERDLRPHVEAGTKASLSLLTSKRGHTKSTRTNWWLSTGCWPVTPMRRCGSGGLARAMRVASGPVFGRMWHDHGGGHVLPSGHYPSHCARLNGTSPGDRSGHRHRFRWCAFPAFSRYCCPGFAVASPWTCAAGRWHQKSI